MDLIFRFFESCVGVLPLQKDFIDLEIISQRISEVKTDLDWLIRESFSTVLSNDSRIEHLIVFKTMD